MVGYIEGYAAGYMYYPKREVISYNGKAYKDSAFMTANFIFAERGIYEQMLKQPTQAGQFKIDIHGYDNDFAPIAMKILTLQF